MTSFPRGQYGKGGKVTSQLKQSKTKRNTSDRHDLSQIKADVNNDKPYGSTCGNGRGREDDRLGASDTLSQLKTWFKLKTVCLQFHLFLVFLEKVLTPEDMLEISANRYWQDVCLSVINEISDTFFMTFKYTKIQPLRCLVSMCSRQQPLLQPSHLLP